MYRFLLIIFMLFVIFASPIQAAIDVVSISGPGDIGDATSSTPEISSDGRNIFFESYASNLVPNDSGNYQDIFIRDTLNGKTELLSISPTGVQSNAVSYSPSISQDGRYIVFDSYATNLDENDTNSSSDVFFIDRANETITRLAIDPEGDKLNRGSSQSDISSDGNYIAFTSNVLNVDPSGNCADDQHPDLYIHNRLTGITECVKDAPDITHFITPRINSDGQFVVFIAWTSISIGPSSESFREIHLHDLASGTTKNLSWNSQTHRANGESYSPDISGDGRYVVYASDADNLVTLDTNDQCDIFLYDAFTDSTTLVSVSESGEQSDGKSFHPKISEDGRYVIFSSNATNLDISASVNGLYQIYIKDLLTQSVHLVSESSSTNGAANGDSFFPSINKDGSVVVFESEALDLVHNSSITGKQIYRARLIDDRQPQTRPILRTNQKLCYDTSGTEISCHKSGQDGEHRTGLMVDLYPDATHDIVHDHTTGLSWQDDYSDNKEYAPNNTTPYLYWHQARDYCSTIEVGGYADWRLPELYEIATLMRYNSNATALDTQTFTHHQNGFYWSSTGYQQNPGEAWVLDMASGSDAYGQKTNEYMYVRCVRGDSFSPSFEKTENAVNDRVMQLQWQDTADTLTNQHSWQQALNYCENLELNDSSNWRLPTISELRSIVNYGSSNPAILPFFTNKQNHSYWSSTTYLPSTNSAWILRSQDGGVGSMLKSAQTFRTRCVRNIELPLHVTKTGQTSCYDSSGQEFSCLESHQDGEYQSGLQHGFDRDDIRGTVYDNGTELTWQDRHDNLPVGQLVKTGTWMEAKEYCNDLELGGYRNWRLPNRQELTMLLDRTGIDFTIDPTFQAKARYMHWWTSSVYAGNTAEAWRVYFNGSGSANPIAKKVTDTAVRCVRGESSLHSSWSRKRDIVTDHSTGLQWQDSSATASHLRNWENALNYCDELVLGNLKDWRLPNINELHSLLDTTESAPALSPIFQNVRPENYGDYWSSTTHEPNSLGNALATDFSSGVDLSISKYSSLYTRCVRGPEKGKPSITMPPIYLLLMEE